MVRLAVVVVLALTACSVAEDWRMGGRTADRNPVSLEKNPVTDWQIETDDKKARNIKWMADAGSRAIGGPVVSGGLVWIGTNNQYPGNENHPTEQFAVLSCIRAADGKEIYRHISPRLALANEDIQDWRGQGLSGSPLINGDRLWFTTNRREVVCLDIGPLLKGTGKPREIWKLDMVKELGAYPVAMMIPGHDTLGSPVEYKEFLYVYTGNSTANVKRIPAPDAPHLVCLRKDTGKVVWKDNSPGKDIMPLQFASPTIAVVNGKAQVIHPQADGWVRSFDALTGKLLWKFDVNRKGAAFARNSRDEFDRRYVVAPPVYADARVYFGAGLTPEASGGPGRLFCVDPTKSGDISRELDDGEGKSKPNPLTGIVWEFAKVGDKNIMHQMSGSVAVSLGCVVAADMGGYLHCLDAKTGRLHWSHDLKERVFANPLVVDETIYAATIDGAVFVMALDKTKKLIAKHEMEHAIVAPPVYSDGTLYVLTEKRLFAIAGKP